MLKEMKEAARTGHRMIMGNAGLLPLARVAAAGGVMPELRWLQGASQEIRTRRRNCRVASRQW